MSSSYAKEEMIQVAHVHPKLKTDASDTKICSGGNKQK
jgi:hypothetical protein